MIRLVVGVSLAVARDLVNNALSTLNDPPPHSRRDLIFTRCQGQPVPFVDIKNVTDEDAALMCSGCPLKRWELADGSVWNICLALGRAEGGAAIGYVYGGQVMRRAGSRKNKVVQSSRSNITNNQEVYA